jgi:hypothetical protein
MSIMNERVLSEKKEEGIRSGMADVNSIEASRLKVEVPKSRCRRLLSVWGPRAPSRVAVGALADCFRSSHRK